MATLKDALQKASHSLLFREVIFIYITSSRNNIVSIYITNKKMVNDIVERLDSNKWESFRNLNLLEQHRIDSFKDWPFSEESTCSISKARTDFNHLFLINNYNNQIDGRSWILLDWHKEGERHSDLFCLWKNARWLGIRG